MLVPPDEIGRYLGNDLSRLEGKVRTPTLDALMRYEVHSKREFGESAIDRLFKLHQLGGKSIADLACDELGISRGNLNRIFSEFGLPTLTRAEGVRRELYRRWQDEDFRQRQAEGVRRELYRRWQDEDFRQRNAEGVRRNWQDKDFRQRQAEGTRRELYRRWQDKDFRQRQAEGTRRELYRRWQDEDFRQRNAEGVRRNWQDEDFRQRNAEGVRRARLDPGKIDRYTIPTIAGYRTDIGYAQSTWEANVARVLHCLGREYSRRIIFELEVPPEFSELFPSDRTDMSIDFLVRDRRGNRIIYEIMAHPLKDPQGYAKLELLAQQQPLRVVAITEKMYRRLRITFEDRINSTPGLAGWETKYDNLRTNPEKYGRR
ncbi:hypothetical protein HYY74_04190 [Candidatus Woesearchaeota archaeon]|nr:hypothetical protein [Candidatus Woesearchaeota archaeon]